jgi:hypothetical protein
VPDFSADIAAELLAARNVLLGYDETPRYQAVRSFLVARSLDAFADGLWLERVYSGPVDLTTALTDGDPRVIAFTPGLLALLDAPAAVGFADRLVDVPADRRAGDFDAYAVGSALTVLDAYPQYLPTDRLLALGLAGRLGMSSASSLLDRVPPSVDVLRSVFDPDRPDNQFRRALRGGLGQRLVSAGDAEAIDLLATMAMTEGHPYAQAAFERLHIERARGGLARVAAVLGSYPLDDARRGYAMAAGLRLGEGTATAAAARAVLAPYLGPGSGDRVVPDSPVWTDLVLASGYVDELDDPGPWVTLAVDALAVPALAGAAKSLLGSLPRAQVMAALDQAGVVPTPPRRAPMPTAIDFFTRYERGEYESVWADLEALGATVWDEPVYSQAYAVGIATMRRVAANLTRIVAVLTEAGYPLAAGRNTFVPAGAGAVARLDELERTLGGRLPLSVRCFYEVIDRVSFAESFTHVYATDCRYEMWGADADPLIITPIAAAGAALRSAVALRGAIPVPLRDPLELRLGPSTWCKYDPDEGPDDEPLRVVLDEPTADPAVRGAGFDASFVGYLRWVVGRGGFGSDGDAALKNGALPF